MKDEVFLLVTGDPPAAMVQLHVMEPAQQDAAVDVGPPVILDPLIEVVCFAEGRRPIAARPSASTVSDGERDALLGCEEAVFAADVERVPTGIDRDPDSADIARLLLGDRRGE